MNATSSNSSTHGNPFRAETAAPVVSQSEEVDDQPANENVPVAEYAGEAEDTSANHGRSPFASSGQNPLPAGTAPDVQPAAPANTVPTELLPVVPPAATPAADDANCIEAETAAVVEAPIDTAPQILATQAELAVQPTSAIAAYSHSEEPPSGRAKTLPFRMLHGVFAACEWCFGVVSLIGMLAFVATIPIVQFLTLGYLLEVSGRIARTGKFTQGFAGIKKAARIGSVLLGTWLFLLPLRFVSEAWYSSNLIDSSSGITVAWRAAQIILTVLIIAHILTAWYCGGRLRHFFWPVLAAPFLIFWGFRKVLSLIHPPNQRDGMSLIERFWADVTSAQPLTSWFPPAIILSGIASGRTFSQSRDAVWDFLVEMRLPYFFWMGVRGFAVAMIWLFIPMMMVMSSILLTGPAAAFFGIQGFLLFMVVLFFLPFLQTNFAAENRFMAGLDLARGVALFVRAPLAFWMALTVLLLSALPLYLLKIEATPREVAWLPSLFFVGFCLPARFINGWAVGRAIKREKPRFFVSWGAAFILTLPVVGFYILMVYFSQYTSWYGSWSLLEQHAFTLPVPPAIDW